MAADGSLLGDEEPERRRRGAAAPSYSSVLRRRTSSSSWFRSPRVRPAEQARPEMSKPPVIPAIHGRIVTPEIRPVGSGSNHTSPTAGRSMPTPRVSVCTPPGSARAPMGALPTNPATQMDSDPSALSSHWRALCERCASGRSGAPERLAPIFARVRRSTPTRDGEAPAPMSYLQRHWGARRGGSSARA